MGFLDTLRGTDSLADFELTLTSGIIGISQQGVGCVEYVWYQRLLETRRRAGSVHDPLRCLAPTRRSLGGTRAALSAATLHGRGMRETGIRSWPLRYALCAAAAARYGGIAGASLREGFTLLGARMREAANRARAVCEALETMASAWRSSGCSSTEGGRGGLDITGLPSAVHAGASHGRQRWPHLRASAGYGRDDRAQPSAIGKRAPQEWRLSGQSSREPRTVDECARQRPAGGGLSRLGRGDTPYLWTRAATSGAGASWA